MRIILFLVLALLCLTYIKKYQNGPEAALSRPALVTGEAQTLLISTRILWTFSGKTPVVGPERHGLLPGLNKMLTNTTHQIKHILK